MTTQLELFTVADAARELGKTPGRIRQLCLEHDIGMFFGRDRLLTRADVERLRDLPDRRRKNF